MRRSVTVIGFATALVAVGIAQAAHGPRWTLMSTPNPSPVGAELAAVSCSAATACMAVGEQWVPMTVGANPVTRPFLHAFAEEWNGGKWTVNAPPSPLVNGVPEDDLRGVSCPDADTCFAVGERGGSPSASPLSERWDGHTWSVLSTPKPPGRSTGIGTLQLGPERRVVYIRDCVRRCW